MIADTSPPMTLQHHGLEQGRLKLEYEFSAWRL